MNFTKGHKADIPRLKREGYKKLSKETWSNGKDKIILSKGRYHSKVSKPNYAQLIIGFKGSGGNNNHSNQVCKCMR
jgi:hypothetical protein